MRVSSEAALVLVDEVLMQSRCHLDPEWWCNRMCGYARDNATKKNIEFNLTAPFIRSLWDQNSGACALTDIYFTDIKVDAHRRPFNPSIDRIDNNQGYLQGNVRIVCSAVNTAMSTWGDLVFTIFCIGRVAAIKRRGSHEIY